MPNWAETEIAAVMPTRNADSFLNLFLSWDGKGNEEKKEYFGRSFLTDSHIEDNGKGMCCVRVSCNCAWSANSCLVKGYPDNPEKGTHCWNLKEAIDKLHIRRLALYAREPLIGFEERANYDRDSDGGKLTCDDRDLFPDPWCEYCDEDEVEDESESPEL